MNGGGEGNKNYACSTLLSFKEIYFFTLLFLSPLFLCNFNGGDRPPNSLKGKISCKFEKDEAVSVHFYSFSLSGPCINSSDEDGPT